MEKLTMTVPEVAEVMGISRAKAYELVHRQDFPVIKVGSKYLIPIDAFHKWLERVPWEK